MSSTPEILILTDGKIGDLVQCRGVASRISTQKATQEKVVKPDWFHALPLPFMPVARSERRGQPDSPLNGDMPDLILASGRRTIPYLRAFRKLRGGRPLPLIVFLKDPRAGRGAADFVWAPVHDRLTGDDVLATHTSPHGFTQSRIDEARAAGKKRFAGEHAPIAGIILGGDSGSVRWDSEMSSQFAAQLADLPNKWTLLVTPSRRTPAVLKNAVADAISSRPHWIWDGEGDNPYLQILTIANRLIVTGDSHNMVSECLAFAKPVYVFRPKGLQNKLHSFLDAMTQRNAVKSIGQFAEPFSAEPIDATDEIVTAIGKKLESISN